MSKKKVKSKAFLTYEPIALRQNHFSHISESDFIAVFNFGYDTGLQVGKRLASDKGRAGNTGKKAAFLEMLVNTKKDQSTFKSLSKKDFFDGEKPRDTWLKLWGSQSPFPTWKSIKSYLSTKGNS